ncbi:hypothetical protein CB1_000964014 [Camelus ferus]|nr:hypothetical protein CB1_000964014 [Camelus ferus]
MKLQKRTGYYGSPGHSDDTSPQREESWSLRAGSRVEALPRYLDSRGRPGAQNFYYRKLWVDPSRPKVQGVEACGEEGNLLLSCQSLQATHPGDLVLRDQGGSGETPVTCSCDTRQGESAGSRWRSRIKLAFNARESGALVRNPGQGEEAQKPGPQERGQKVNVPEESVDREPHYQALKAMAFHRTHRHETRYLP